MAKLVETLRYKEEGRGFDSQWRHWNVSVALILPAAPWHSASEINEHQEYFLGVKAAGA